MIYHVLTAEVNGSLKTALVCAEEMETADPADYLVGSVRNPEDHRTVEISGPAEHMIPDYVIEG
jgi:hypothetical protein